MGTVSSRPASQAAKIHGAKKLRPDSSAARTSFDVARPSATSTPIPPRQAIIKAPPSMAPISATTGNAKANCLSRNNPFHVKRGSVPLSQVRERTKAVKGEQAVSGPLIRASFWA